MSKPVEDWELSAYVDGDLPARRMAEIDAVAASRPEIAVHLAELLADHRLLAMIGRADDRVETPLPPDLSRLADRLTAALGPDRPAPGGPSMAQHSWAWRQIAGGLAGIAVGWAAASWAAPRADALADFIDESTEIHQIATLAPAFAREPSPTVIRSMEALFAHKLTPPDLSDAGFTLARVDVAATDTGPAAVFFYADPEARRLSLVLSLDSPVLDALGPSTPGHVAADRDGAAPRVTTHDGLAVSFGRDGGIAYALVGSVPEPRALRLADRVSEALRR